MPTRSTATNKNSLYDSYIRAIRWATDRIGDAGVVAFVTNGGWIDANTADGMRLSLADEFARIYVFNLRGNQRTAGELSPHGGRQDLRRRQPEHRRDLRWSQGSRTIRDRAKSATATLATT